MKKCLIVVVLVSAWFINLEAQTTDSIPMSKFSLAITGSYQSLTNGGEAGSSYAPSPSATFSIGYFLKPQILLETSVSYGFLPLLEKNALAIKFPVKKTNAGAPYSGVEGGNIRLIGTGFTGNYYWETTHRWKPVVSLGLNYNWLEVAPLNAFDKTGNYQILRNYINESALGLTAGTGILYQWGNHIATSTTVSYSTLFTSSISKNISLLNIAVTVQVRF